MASNPIQLPDGNTITNWDAATIEVTNPTGGITRIARAAAPVTLQQAVGAAEASGALPLRPQAAPPAANPYGVITGPAGEVPGGMATNIDGPAAAVPPATTPDLTGAPASTDPLAPYDDEIERLRSMPQVGYSPGVTKTATQTTKPAQEGVEQANEYGLDATVATEGAAQAAEAEGEALAAGEQEVAKILAEQTRREEQQIADLRTDEQRFQQRYDQELSKLQQLNEQARAEIDPQRWWKEKDTGQKIVAALSIGLGGFGDRLIGRPNGALQQINRFIEQDIDAQIANREGKRAEASDQVGFMQLLKGQYQTRQDERRAGIILGREYAANLAEYQARITNSDVIKQQKIQLAQQLRAQNAKDAQQLALATAGTVTTQTQQVGGGYGPTAAARAADALSKAVYGDFNEALYIPGAEKVLGVPMQALRAEEAGDLRNGLARAQVMMANVQKLKALYAKGSSFSPEDRRESEQIRSRIITDLNTVAKLGALSQDDAKWLLQQLGPNVLEVTTASNVLPGFEADLRARMNSELQNRAVRVNPASVPLAWRARNRPGGMGSGGAPPPTQPLSEGM